MKFIPTSKDAIALTCVTLITLGLFISGLCGVLDFFIIKVVLIISTLALFVVATNCAIKNYNTKNRLEDKPQDDSN